MVCLFEALGLRLSTFRSSTAPRDKVYAMRRFASSTFGIFGECGDSVGSEVKHATISREFFWPAGSNNRSSKETRFDRLSNCTALATSMVRREVKFPDFLERPTVIVGLDPVSRFDGLNMLLTQYQIIDGSRPSWLELRSPLHLRFPV
jgi:hypothetical protein